MLKREVERDFNDLGFSDLTSTGVRSARGHFPIGEVDGELSGVGGRGGGCLGIDDLLSTRRCFPASSAKVFSSTGVGGRRR